MTGCSDDVYTVSCVLSVQRKVRAKDADEARRRALKQGFVKARPGVGVGFPIEIEVVKEVPVAVIRP